MRSLLILALAAGCGHRYAPTSEWCQSYVGELRASAASNVHAMTLNAANRQRGAEDLLASVGSDPAIRVAFKACSDADGDSPAANEARNVRVNDLHAQISDYVILHRDKVLDEAQANQLLQLFEQLASSYTAPAS